MYDSTKAIETKQAVRVTMTTPHTTETSDDQPASIADVNHPPMEVPDDTLRVPHTDEAHIQGEVAKTNTKEI